MRLDQVGDAPGEQVQFGSFHELREIEGEAQPRSTMLIAQQTHLASVQPETREVTVELVEQGVLMAMAADRIAHEQTVERIRRLHKLGLLVAERVAAGQPVYPGQSRGAVRRALESLRDAAIIESYSRGCSAAGRSPGRGARSGRSAAPSAGAAAGVGSPWRRWASGWRSPPRGRLRACRWP